MKKYSRKSVFSALALSAAVLTSIQTMDVNAQETINPSQISESAEDFVVPEVGYEAQVQVETEHASREVATPVGHATQAVIEEDISSVGESPEETASETPLAAAISEEDFEFNAEEGKITDYTGEEKNVVIPEVIGETAVETIGYRSLYKDGLETLVIPSSVKTIENQAVAANAGLTKVEFSNGLESIGQGAFLLAGIKNLDLPDTLEWIDRLAFSNNSNLETIQFNEGLIYIGQQAFNNASQLHPEITLPSTLEHLMTSSFAGTNVTTLNVKGGADSAALTIHSGISNSLNEINIEDPGKAVYIVFNTRGCTAGGEVNVNLGQIESNASTWEELQSQLAQEVNVEYAAISVNQNEADGLHDLMYSTPLEWEIDYEDEETNIIHLKATPTITNADIQQVQGYTPASPDSCMVTTVFHLPVQRVEAVPEVPAWVESDFNYERFQYTGPMQLPVTKLGVSSLSEEGQAKLVVNPHLVIPTTVTIEEDGVAVEHLIEGVLPRAFENSATPIRSVVIPEMPAGGGFVIGSSAFKNTGLEEVTLNDGVLMIDTGAFQDNNLQKVDIPASVWKIGNSAFQDNEILELNISDGIVQLQMDNYSFRNNQLREVNLPYSIFKFLGNVFQGNPGTEALPADELLAGDPEGTGIVQLYTRNPAHLGTETYIYPSQYHNIMLVSEGIERDSLWNLLHSSTQLNLEDYAESHADEFSTFLNQAQSIFSDADSTQEEIDAAADELALALGELRASAPDRTQLRDELKKAEELQAELFAEGSWSNFAQAYQRARDISYNQSATTEEVNQAAEDLRNAMGQLVISEAYQYTRADFSYSGQVITGFSESGRDKFAVNKDVVLPDTNQAGEDILEIADKAFEMPVEEVVFGNNTVNSPNGIRSVVLPASLEKIGNLAFRYNNLETITFPETLVTIGNSAFHSNQLVSVDLPDSVTSVGIAAFGLNKIVDLSLSKGMTEIADAVFSNNYQLQNVKLHEGLTSIGQSAFIGAPLTQLKIPSTLTTIGRMAFQAHRLESLTIPGNVETIGRSAFMQNVKWRTLTELILEEGVESIGQSAFADALLQEVLLPGSLTSLHAAAFQGNFNEDKENIIVTLYTTNPDHLAFNTEKSLANQVVVLLSDVFEVSDFTYEGQTITGFSQTGLAKLGMNKDLVIPAVNPEGDDITAIGNAAFNGIDLESVTFPDTLESIGNLAFHTNNLSSVYLPDSVTSVGIAAFGTNNITDIRLSPNMTVISNGMFTNNTGLESIELPEGIVEIQQAAFFNAPLKELIIPTTVHTIGRTAFQNHRLESLTIPGSVRTIDISAFQQHVNFRTLTDLILEEGIESIGNTAFRNGLLQEVYLPTSLQTLSPTAFRGNADENGETIVVTLYTTNPDHLEFNTEASLQHQIVVLIEEEEEANVPRPPQNPADSEDSEDLEDSETPRDSEDLEDSEDPAEDSDDSEAPVDSDDSDDPQTPGAPVDSEGSAVGESPEESESAGGPGVSVDSDKVEGKSDFGVAITEVSNKYTVDSNRSGSGTAADTEDSLPQTGAGASFLGLGAAAILSGLGLAVKNRRRQ